MYRTIAMPQPPVRMFWLPTRREVANGYISSYRAALPGTATQHLWASLKHHPGSTATHWRPIDYSVNGSGYHGERLQYPTIADSTNHTSGILTCSDTATRSQRSLPRRVCRPSREP